MAPGGGNGVGGMVGGYGDSTSAMGGANVGMERDCSVASAFSATRARVNDTRYSDAIKLTFVQKLELNGSGDVTICGITYDLGSKGTAIDERQSNALLGDIWGKIGDIQEWIAEVWMRMGRRDLDGLGIVMGNHGRGMDASVLQREKR